MYNKIKNELDVNERYWIGLFPWLGEHEVSLKDVRSLDMLSNLEEVMNVDSEESCHHDHGLEFDGCPNAVGEPYTEFNTKRKQQYNNLNPRVRSQAPEHLATVILEERPEVLTDFITESLQDAIDKRIEDLGPFPSSTIFSRVEQYIAVDVITTEFSDQYSVKDGVDLEEFVDDIDVIYAPSKHALDDAIDKRASARWHKEWENLREQGFGFGYS